MTQPIITHMDLDSFFVSVERLRNSALVGKPVIIGGNSDRGVVASCSYEARSFGIHSAMPMKQAKQLCPNATIIRGDSQLYSDYSRDVTSIIAESVPLYEKSSIDEFYIDLTGMEKFFGSWKLAMALKDKILRETGLPISFGLASNKTVSKVATGTAKPSGQRKVDFGEEIPFLAPLSVRKIPGVGTETYKTLRGLGIQYIKTLQEMPMELLFKTLQKPGIDLWKKAQGIDHRKVEPYQERKSIGTERTFEKDTIDVVKLRNIISAMAENLAYQLRKGDKLCACITVKVRYSDFNTHTLQAKIPYTSADHVLIGKSLELFDKLYNRRLLIRLIGVRLSDLVSGGFQMNLFEDSEEMANLYQAMDRLRNRYGNDAVKRANGLEIHSLGRSDNPFDGGPPLLLANRRQ
ncbi:MAG: polymerase [Bacteroidota bacterium]|jgi:DNA polymerase-4|nr:DNA polymerase IV [Bacteroidia bacterium]